MNESKQSVGLHHKTLIICLFVYQLMITNNIRGTLMRTYKQYEPSLLSKNLMSFNAFIRQQEETKKDISTLSQYIKEELPTNDPNHHKERHDTK